MPAPAPSLEKERIADLQEEGSVGLREGDSERPELRVGVAGEQHGLRVDLVREEELPEEVPLPAVDGEQVERRIAFDVLVLNDGAYEGADVELIDDARLSEPGVEEPAGGDPQPRVLVRRVDVEVLAQADLNRGEPGHRPRRPGIVEVDVVSELSGEPELETTRRKD